MNPVVPRFTTEISSPDSSRGTGTLAMAAVGGLFCCMGTQLEPGRVLFLPLVLGSVLLLLAGAIGSSSTVFTIDKTQNRYLHSTYFLGIPLSQWQELPPLTGVVVRYFSEYTRKRPYARWGKAQGILRNHSFSSGSQPAGPGRDQVHAAAKAPGSALSRRP